MTNLTFIRSTIVAFFLSLAASVLFLSASLFYQQEAAIQITTSLISFGYILFLLNQADVGFGRVSTVTLYIFASALMLIWSPSLLTFTLFHVACIWLVRTVYHHTSFFMSVADLGFTIIGFTAAIGAVLQTHSVFLSFWSFLLAQSMALPILRYAATKFQTQDPAQPPHHSSIESEHAFQQAHRNAESALTKLAQSN